MKLKSFRVQEFQSIRDSGPVTLDDIICLIGKNESGKTALLRALYRLNPIVAEDGKFNVTLDYPRMEVEDYRHALESGKRTVAVPIQACFALEDDEVREIEQCFGPHCLKSSELTLSKNYDNAESHVLSVDENEALLHLIQNAVFSEATRDALETADPDAASLLAVLRAQEQSEEVRRVTRILEAIANRNIDGYIWDSFLATHVPKFMYFDEYYQLTGHENIEALVQRESAKQLRESDYPLLGLIRLARLTLPELLNPSNTIELKNKLEGAGNHLTKQVLKYWSQDKHLRMSFDVRPARSGDPSGMQQGANLWGGVFDTRHNVTTELGARSRGFVWFFSFLAWYSDVKRNAGPVILLLDEPSSTLHAKAQYDLLRYFEAELKGQHQLIYSTHSPFMVDPQHFDRVRIVQDNSIEVGAEGIEQTGTKVLTDVSAATRDSIFPLQGALGYELHQALFVDPVTLVVKGAADLLFLQGMSAILEGEGRTGLDPCWTITPVGGAARIPAFVALLGAQKGMTIATLIDNRIADQQKIESLYKDKLLRKANVFTFASFVKTPEADIEDMFGADFYCDLVNIEFASQLTSPIVAMKLTSQNPRIVQRIEDYLAAPSRMSGKFNPYRPARYFTEHLGDLSAKLHEEAKDRFEAAFKALNALL